MEQFNHNTYKKATVWQDFYHSCLGKAIILAILCFILFLIAIMSKPTESMMRWQMTDNIHECLQANDSIQQDQIDDYVGNLGHIITHADTTQTHPDLWKTYQKQNRLEIYDHTFYRTARIVNNIHPAGVRVGIGIFGIVFPTVKYSDLLLNTGRVRGNYNERIIRDISIPDEYMGENPYVKPYHYQGNPDN